MAKRPIVLVAEDDVTDVAFLQLAIAKANPHPRFEFVNDGVEALEYLQRAATGSLAGEGLPAVLLLDLKMPRMNGFEVLEWLQRQPRLRPATVAVFSSAGRWEELHRACLLGVNHYFVKPMDLAELIGIVKQLEHYCPDQGPAAAELEPGREELVPRCR
jgi:two-component system response regulator